MAGENEVGAPAPERPVVGRALVREFRYEYAAVSPWSGDLDHMTLEKMDTEHMSTFLKKVSETHERDFIVMVLDGAPSHKGKELEVPENMALVFLPPYSPELNPAERLWNALRRDYFANRVFDSLTASTVQAEQGLAHMASFQRTQRRLQLVVALRNRPAVVRGNGSATRCLPEWLRARRTGRPGVAS